MIATGSIILTHANGWACAKECAYGVEFDPRPNKTAVTEMVFKPTGWFEAVGKIERGQKVEGAFLGDDNTKISFSGIYQGKTRIVVVGEVGNEFKSIIKKIKLWQ